MLDLEAYFSPHFSMCIWYMMMVTVWYFLVLPKYSILLSILILITTLGGRYCYSHIPLGKLRQRYVKEFAKKNGCYDITLNVWEGNDSAKAFYEAMGFKVLKYGMEIVL